MNDQPISFLENHLSCLRKGKALDIAMGEGRNAVFLAQMGFQVSGFDISKEAVAKAEVLARTKGVTLETKVCDLDFYLFPMLCFDTIIMTYFKPIPRYFFEIKRCLVQGGTFLVENYTTDQFLIEKEPHIAPEACFKPNELLGHLDGLRILFYQEATIEGRALVQCVAKKPFDKDALKYGFATHDKGASTTHESAFTKRAEDLFKKK